MAQDYFLDTYRARGDDGMVRKLEAAPVSIEDGLSPAWMRLCDAANGIFIPLTEHSAQ